ncbi:hypothetical protein [Deinococcus altitudinis]|uniref:hypothetical protein n=1 Tax=Deinococcus altitudinis TaxID=468914 RepID=UPI003892C069
MTDIGDITAGVGFIVNTASLQAALIRAEAMATQRPVIVRVGLDPAQVTGAMAKVQAELMRGASIKVGLDSTTIQAALRGVTTSVDQNVTATQARINTLFGNMGSYAQGAARASADAFKQADREGQQNATNYRQTLRLNIGLENEAAQNYRKNMQLNLQLAAQRAAAEKAAATAVISAAQQSAQAFNDAAQRSKQALDGIRLAYSQARATFDKNDGAASNWQQSRDAALAYQRSVQGVSTALAGLKNSGEATVVQLKQIADMEARLAREQNTLAGGINRLGISGNFSNAISGAQQLSMFMPGLIGQSLGAASAFQQIAASSGVMGVALGAAGLAVFALGKAFTETSQAFGAFQQGLQGISSIDTSLSGVDMQGIADDLQTLSTQLPITTEQLTNMARGAVQMGITGKDSIMEFVNSIALLAVATRDNNKSLGDTGQLANELGVFLNETGSTARTYTDDLKGVVATLAAVDKVTPGTIQSTLSLARYMASGSVVLNLSKESIIGLSGALSGLGARAEAGGSAVIRVLMAMNRAAGGTKDQMAGLEGVAGITKDELANVFQGSVTVKANAFASVMGVTADEFKNLVRTNPAQAFQLLAEGLAKAHASGVDMTAAMDAMGIKNVRDIRLIDQLTVGHANLKIALDASSNSSKNQADLQDRVQKATQNSVDKTTELKNAWTAAAQSFGETSAPAYNYLLDFLTKAARGAKEFADNMRGVSSELTQWQSNSGVNLSVLKPEDAARVQTLVDNIKYLSEKAQNGGLSSTEQKTYTGYVAELERIRSASVQTQGGGTFSGSGPILPGQTRGAAATDAGLNILNASATATGNTEADNLIKWCARWVKLTLDKAQPGAKAEINRWFAGDADDIKNRLIASNKLEKYSGNVNDLAPGDVVVYDKNHIGIYIGNGMVRGNNTLGGRNGAPVTDERINSLGSIAGIVRAANAASGFSGAPALSLSGGTGGAADDAKARATGQKIYDAYYVDGDHSKKVVDALRAFRKAHADVWQGIMADGAEAKKKLKDTGLTDAQWAQYKGRAMELAELQAKQQAGKLSQSQSLAATQDITSYNSDPTKAKAFAFATSELARQKTLTTQNLQADQQAAAESARISKALTAGKVADAQSALQRLKQIQSDELDNAGENQAKRLAVVKQTSQQIFNAEEALARVTRKAALEAAADEKDPTLSAALIKKANSDYTLSLETARTARVKAMNAAEKALDAQVLQDKKKHEDDLKAQEQARQQVVQQARELDVKGAELSYAALKRQRDQELIDAGDNVAKKLAIQKRYADDLRKSQEDIALAQLKIDKAAANSGPAQNRAQGISNAYSTYYGSLAEAKDPQAITQATEAQTQAVQKQRDGYSQLADSIRASIAQGTFDETQRQAALVSFNALGRASEKLGLTHQANVEGARKASYALIEEASGVDKATTAYEAYWKAQADHQDNGARADAGMRGSYGVGQEGLEAALLGSGANRKLLGDPAAALADLDQFNKEAADRIRRVYADELVQFQGYHDAVNASILETTTAAYAQIKQGMADDQAAADEASTTVDSLSVMLKGILANGLDPQTSGYVQLLDDIITKGGQAGDAAKQVKDNLDLLISEALAPSLKDVLSNPEAYADGVFGKDASAPDPSVTAALKGQVDQQFTEGLKKLSDAELKLAESQATAAGRGEELAQIFGEQKRRADEAVQSISKLAAIDLQGKTNTLEFQHANGLVTEAQYIDKKQALQRQAAWQTWQDAQKAGGNMEAATAQLWADLLKADQDGTLARRTLSADDATKRIEWEKEVAASVVTIRNAQLSTERTHLDNLHSASLVSDRDFQAEREQQDRDAALANFDAGTSDWFQYQEELTRITRQGVVDRAALDKAGIDGLVQGLQSLGGTFEQLDGLAGLFGKTLSSIGGGIQMLQKVPDLMTKTSSAMKSGNIFDLAGAAGGWLGMASEAINLIGGIGDAILNLSPGFAAWKKNLTEVANLEKAAAGASVGLFKNPFADALNEDAANRNKLAGANFWQRAAWAIFGGAPEVLSDEAAKLKTSAATIFADLGQGISSSLTDGLMNAFNTADWSGSEEMFEKSLNKTLAGMYIAATVKASGLEAAVQAYAEAKANGQDGVTELAKVRDLAMGVFSSAQTGISALTGYGADATSGITSKGLGTYLSDSQSSVQFGLPSMEMKFPDSAIKGFDTLYSGATELYTGATELRSAVAEWRAYMGGGSGSSGPPPRSGDSALAGM